MAKGLSQVACQPHSLAIPGQVTPLLPSSPVVGLPPGFLHLPILSQQVPLLYCPPVTQSCFVCFLSGPGRAPRLVGRKWSLEPTLSCLPHSSVGLALFFLSAGPPWAGGSCGRWGQAGWQALHPPAHALPGVSIPVGRTRGPLSLPHRGHRLKGAAEEDRQATDKGAEGESLRLKKKQKSPVGRTQIHKRGEPEKQTGADRQTDREERQAGPSWKRLNQAGSLRG